MFIQIVAAAARLSFPLLPYRPPFVSHRRHGQRTQQFRREMFRGGNVASFPSWETFWLGPPLKAFPTSISHIYMHSQQILLSRTSYSWDASLIFEDEKKALSRYLLSQGRLTWCISTSMYFTKHCKFVKLRVLYLEHLFSDKFCKNYIWVVIGRNPDTLQPLLW